MSEQPPTDDDRSAEGKTGGTLLLKAGLTLVLVFLLHLGLVQVHSLIGERMGRQNQVLEELTHAWAGDQTLAGPVIAVPLGYGGGEGWRQAEGDDQDQRYLFILPDQLNIAGDLSTQTRHRGIFEAVLYTADLAVVARFGFPQEDLSTDAGDELDWSRAVLAIGLSDPNGLSAAPHLTTPDREVAFGLADSAGPLAGRLVAPLGLTRSPRETLQLSYALPLRGTGSLNFQPLATRGEVTLSADWPHPSFGGRYLPDRHDINTHGFSAHWGTVSLGSRLSEVWPPERASGQAQSFGFALKIPVDHYRAADRLTKHGLLLVLLVFVALIAAEVLGTVRLHIAHYALVGAALALFYLMLLALSEVLGLRVAYWASAAGTLVLVTLYLAAVLRSKRQAAWIGGLTLGAYLYMFVVIQLQSLALVMGALGLFLTLAVVMYATRRLDWHRLAPLRMPARAWKAQLPARSSASQVEMSSQP